MSPPAAPSEPFARWVIDVYEPAVATIAEAFIETTGQRPETADHFARACLARLASRHPAITVQLLDRT